MKEERVTAKAWNDTDAFSEVNEKFINVFMENFKEKGVRVLFII
jgi:hypothetical protein